MDNKKNIISESYSSYIKSPYSSLKQSTYFNIYDELFSKYKDQEITFIEIGVLDGGSLFMWKNFFGTKAKIIGIDLNPDAKKWEKEGFEIYIGDQSKEKFWDDFFNKVGKVDIVLDDGGHTYEQQIMTVECSIPFIKENGLIVVEDCHTSYMTRFGLKKLSFINYAKKLIDNVNYRFMLFNHRKTVENRIWSIRFFESIVAFNFNTYAISIKSERTLNGNNQIKAKDFRYASYPEVIDKLDNLSSQRLIKNLLVLRPLIRLIRKIILASHHLRKYINLKRYLKSKNIY